MLMYRPDPFSLGPQWAGRDSHVTCLPGMFSEPYLLLAGCNHCPPSAVVRIAWYKRLACTHAANIRVAHKANRDEHTHQDTAAMLHGHATLPPSQCAPSAAISRLDSQVTGLLVWLKQHDVFHDIVP